MFALDVGVEMAFLSRRIVTERTFMGSLSRVREEVSLNMTLLIAPKPTVLPRTPVLLLVGVHPHRTHRASPPRAYCGEL